MDKRKSRLKESKNEIIIAAAKKAIELNPSAADAYFGLGHPLFFSSKPKEALDYLQKANLLNPMPPSDYYLFIGHCYRSLERFTEALEAYKKAVEIGPSNIYAHLGLAVLYIFMGRDHEARAAASKVLRIDPDFSVNAIRKSNPHKDLDGEKSYYEAARKAGLPE